MRTAAVDEPSRHTAYIAAAQEMFFSHGYAGTTMSSIAAAVGGSKTTLWSCFPRKEDLFVAVVDTIVERFGLAISIELDPGLPLDVALRRFGMAMMTTVLSEPILALHRLVTGEAGRFPELGALFYDRGPRRGKERLAAYVEAAMADGRLRKGDALLAVGQFAAMCQGHSFTQRLYGIGEATRETITAEVDAATEVFLRAWSTKPQD